MQDKPKMVLVTKPEEIEAIRRNELADPIGAEYHGQWFAYEWSIKQWRERARTSASDG